MPLLRLPNCGPVVNTLSTCRGWEAWAFGGGRGNKVSTRNWEERRHHTWNSSPVWKAYWPVSFSLYKGAIPLRTFLNPFQPEVSFFQYRMGPAIDQKSSFVWWAISESVMVRYDHSSGKWKKIFWQISLLVEDHPSNLADWGLLANRGSVHDLNLECVKLLQGLEGLRPGANLWALIMGPLVTQQREFTALHKIPSMAVNPWRSIKLSYVKQSFQSQSCGFCKISLKVQFKTLPFKIARMFVFCQIVFSSIEQHVQICVSLNLLGVVHIVDY